MANRLKDWKPEDDTYAKTMGWHLRPYRYVEEDGCWTIRHLPNGPFLHHHEAIRFVLQRACFRDGCDSRKQWETCQKAAALACGSIPDKPLFK